MDMGLGENPAAGRGSPSGDSQLRSVTLVGSVVWNSLIVVRGSSGHGQLV